MLYLAIRTILMMHKLDLESNKEQIISMSYSSNLLVVP